MATKVIVICDDCGSDDGVKTYDLAQGTRKAKVDLCVTHGEPIEQYLPKQVAKKTATKKAAAKKTSSRRSSAAKKKIEVLTLEEIERLKKPE